MIILIRMGVCNEWLCIVSKKQKHNNHCQVRKNATLPPESRKLMCTARPNWLSLSTTFFNKEECHKVFNFILLIAIMVVITIIVSLCSTFFNKEEVPHYQFVPIIIPDSPPPLWHLGAGWGESHRHRRADGHCEYRQEAHFIQSKENTRKHV